MFSEVAVTIYSFCCKEQLLIYYSLLCKRKAEDHFLLRFLSWQWRVTRDAGVTCGFFWTNVFVDNAVVVVLHLKKGRWISWCTEHQWVAVKRFWRGSIFSVLQNPCVLLLLIATFLLVLHDAQRCRVDQSNDGWRGVLQRWRSALGLRHN